MRRLVLVSLVASLSWTGLPAAVASPVASASGPSAAATTDRGPRLEVTPRALRRALTCWGDLGRARRPPVLLVHGTGTTGRETWNLGYRQSLRAAGHAVCVVDLPRYGSGDVQLNAQYVVGGLRHVQRRAPGKASVVALSKGATETLLALRVWPDVARRVDDVVMLAGALDRGSRALADRCGGGARCVPGVHQVAAGSNLLRTVSRIRLPRRISYTAIGTPIDATVTPQPRANRQRGVRSISLDAVCPGRAERYGVGHAQILGDAVARQLVRDALTRRGPASPARIRTRWCDRAHFTGFDQRGFDRLAARVAARRIPTVLREPAVRQWLRAAARAGR